MPNIETYFIKFAFNWCYSIAFNSYLPQKVTMLYPSNDLVSLVYSSIYTPQISTKIPAELLKEQ